MPVNFGYQANVPQDTSDKLIVKVLFEEGVTYNQVEKNTPTGRNPDQTLTHDTVAVLQRAAAGFLAFLVNGKRRRNTFLTLLSLRIPRLQKNL